MMKKTIVILISTLMLTTSVFASDDPWADFSNVDNAWDGQKTITNKEFEATMDALQERSKKREAKQREKAIRKVKGSSLTPELDAHNDTLVNEQPDETLDTVQVVNIPVDFYANDKIIERGYYKVTGKKEKDGVYIFFYQGHSLVAKIKARETNDDFDEETIQFIKVNPCNDHQLKLIFGSVDFNAYTYLTFIEPQSIDYAE